MGIREEPFSKRHPAFCVVLCCVVFFQAEIVVQIYTLMSAFNANLANISLCISLHQDLYTQDMKCISNPIHVTQITNFHISLQTSVPISNFRNSSIICDLTTVLKYTRACCCVHSTHTTPRQDQKHTNKKPEST